MAERLLSELLAELAEELGVAEMEMWLGTCLEAIAKHCIRAAKVFEQKPL